MKLEVQFFWSSFFCSSLFFGQLCATDPSVECLKEELKGSSHVHNLIINITCNPQQIIKDIKQDFVFLLGRMPKVPVRKYSNLCVSSICDNRYKLAGSAFIAVYVVLFYEVIKGNTFLGNQDSWAMWKQDMPLAHFLEIPYSELAQELLTEIQRRYTDAEKPTDFISSLIAFMRDIDYEIKRTKYFINLESWLKTARIARLFPFNSSRFASASDRLGRLSYIRNIFLTWAAHYKMDKNKRFPL